MRSGCLAAAATLAIGMADVLVASSASARTIDSSCAITACLTARFSKTASMTASQRAMCAGHAESASLTP